MKTIHTAGDVRWLLRVMRQTGSPFKGMTDAEAATYLVIELAKGHIVVPLSPCDNFDPMYGCRGHEHGA